MAPSEPRLSACGIAILFSLAAAPLRSQPAQPWINLQSTPGGSNLVFQLATQPGWFYTARQSTNLTDWGYAADYFANGDSLNWTNPVAGHNPQMFFRVSVNAPNMAAVLKYHSWTNVVSINNGLVEALISPTDGRVQQFRFLGATNGALWENPALYGQAANNAVGYNNFGGDKAWPSPQSAWGWPPPTGFDGSTNTASFTNGVVTLVTPVDATYKIQTTRVIELLFNEPVMRITTTFQRTATSTKTGALGVWIDCQAVVTNTSRCYVPVPSPSIFSHGYTTNGSSYFTAALPPAFTNTNGLISFSMPATGDQKLGFDSGTLVLVGTNLDLRVDAPRVAGATYPDGNSSTEVYTDQGYFELELLGPLSTLPVGGQMKFVTVYSLFRRTEPTTDAEAQKVLSWQY
jgi:hypothetical protein